MGNLPREEPLVDQWMDFCSSELDPLLQVIYFPFLEYMEQDERQGQALRGIKEALQYIEDSLEQKGFLVGKESTLADLSVAVSLLCPFRDIFMETFSPDLPKLTRFLEEMNSILKLRRLPQGFRQLKRMEYKGQKPEKIEGNTITLYNPKSPSSQNLNTKFKEIELKTSKSEIVELRSKVERLESETEILKKTILELNLELSDKQFTLSDHAQSSQQLKKPKEIDYSDPNIKTISSKNDLSPKSEQVRIEEVEEPISEETSSKKQHNFTQKNPSSRDEENYKYYGNRKISIANTFGKPITSSNNRDLNSEHSGTTSGNKKGHHSRHLTFRGTDEFTTGNNSGTKSKEASGGHNNNNSDRNIGAFHNPFYNKDNNSKLEKDEEDKKEEEDESSDLIENFFQPKKQINQKNGPIQEKPERDTPRNKNKNQKHRQNQQVEEDGHELSVDGSQLNTSINNITDKKYPTKSSLRNMYKNTKQKSTIGFSIPDEKPAIRRALARQNTMALPKEGDDKILNKGKEELQAQFIENELDDSLDQFNTSEVRATPEVEIKPVHVHKFPSIREMKNNSQAYENTPHFASYKDHKRSFEKQIPSFEKTKNSKLKQELESTPKKRNQTIQSRGDRMERESNFSMTDLEKKMAKWSKFTKK